MNFTKPNRDTIRYINSQWLREDAPEMPVGMVCLLGECHEPGSEGTELMGNIAGARLVAQTEHGGSAVRAQPERSQSAVRAGSVRGQSAARARSERGQCAVRARSERGQSAVRARSEGAEWMEKKLPGRERTGNNLNCCCFPERESSAGGCRGREDQRAETHFPWPYGLTISTGWTLDLSSGAVRYLVREKSMDFTSMQRIFWFQAVR